MENIYHFFRGIAEQSDFIIFGPTHIGLLLITLIGCIFISKMKNTNRKIELFIGSILMLQQAMLYTWYLLSRYNQIIEGLPLYHCRLAIILVGVGFIFKKSILRKIGSIWGIFGAIAALLYPGLDPFLFPHITQFSYFIGHIFLAWGSVYCLCVEKITLSITDYKIALIFTNTYHMAMFILNHSIGSNYGYMRVSPIGIGNNLPPVLYGFIVMTIFNVVIKVMYTITRNRNIENENYNTEKLTESIAV